MTQFWVFLLISCAVLAAPLSAQTKEQLLQKIKSGEIKVTPEMVQQGRAMLKEEGGAGIPLQPRRQGILGGRTAQDTSFFHSDSVFDSLAFKQLEDSLKKAKPTLLDEYTRLVKSSLEELNLRYFGSEFFSPGFGVDLAPASPSNSNHVIAPGDEIIVYSWGRETGTHSVRVDNDGYLNYPPLPPLKVAGLTFDRARSLIKSSVERISGLQARVSMGQANSVTVMLVGDVLKPGSQPVSGGVSVIDALAAGGGISPVGSYRKVVHKRAGKSGVELDLYKLLVNGDDKGFEPVANGDMIFVPVAKAKVAVAGFVKRPAIYEAKEGEKLSEVIRFAGGLSPMADANRIVIERISGNKEKIVLNVRYLQKTGELDSNITARDGDLIKIFPLLSADETNSIYISGNVFAPGKYQFRDGLTLKALLPNPSHLKPQTFFDYAVVKRVTAPDDHYEYVPFSLQKVYFESGDFPLQARDTLFIFGRWELLDSLFIEVEGNVRKPGRIPYLENMRVSDAVVAAGGFKEETYLDEIHVLKFGPEIEKTALIKVNLNSVFKDYTTPENAVLGPNDKVMVFSVWNFNFQDSVNIIGEVKVPGRFKFVQEMTVADLVNHAGGYKEGTYKLYIEVVRAKVVGDSVDREEIIKLDIKRGTSGGVGFKLKPRDDVYIRQIIDYNKTISVKLGGMFKFPGSYRAEKDEHLSSVIRRAGGFKENAFLPGIIFTRVTVRERQQEHLRTVAEKLEEQLEGILVEGTQGVTAEDQAYRNALIRQRMDMLERLKSSVPLGRVVIKVNDIDKFAGSDYDLVVKPGDSLFVPENLTTVSVFGDVFAPVTVVYSRKTNSVSEVLAKAGGPTEYGDEDNIYLVLADGSVVTQRTTGLFQSFMGMDVGPGATIVVPPKTPKKSYLGDVEKITSIIYNLAVTTGVVVTLTQGK